MLYLVILVRFWIRASKLLLSISTRVKFFFVALLLRFSRRFDMKMWIHNELTWNSHERSKFSHYVEHWILFAKLWLLLLLFLLGQVTLSIWRWCDEHAWWLHEIFCCVCVYVGVFPCFAIQFSYSYFSSSLNGGRIDKRIQIESQSEVSECVGY